MKLLALTLLQVIKAFKYDRTAPGACPYKPGDLATKVEMDTSLLPGVWLNVYDRKDLNDDIKCYSVMF
jgi:hypothetical protein